MPRKRIQIPQSTALLASGPPFEPNNEAGVAMIFGRFADALGFKIKSAQVPYPDCTAVYRGETLRIELEYVSKHFEAHGHDPRKCDLVVRWKHVWPKMHAAPKYSELPVLKLRKQFGHGWGVWIQGLAAEYAVHLPKGNRYSDGLFSVAASAGADDLVLVYHPSPTA